MKRTITVETVQKTVIRRVSAPPKTIWCEFCAAKVKMLAPAESAALAGLTERKIFQKVETGELHFTETPEGKLLICGGSLKKIAIKTYEKLSEEIQ